MSDRLLSMRQVCEATSLHRATIYRLEASGQFGSRRRISRGRVGYLESDVRRFIESRPEIAAAPDA